MLRHFCISSGAAGLSALVAPLSIRQKDGSAAEAKNTPKPNQINLITSRLDPDRLKSDPFQQPRSLHHQGFSTLRRSGSPATAASLPAPIPL